MVAFRKKVAIAVVAGVIIASMLHVSGKYYSIAIARQECLPYRLWLIEKGVTPKKGDYVRFNGTGIPHYGQKARLVKYVAGIKGDVITASISKGDEYRDVEIEGRLYRMKLKGTVTITGKGAEPKHLDAFEKGRDGKKLPFVFKDGETVVIPDGYFFVIGTHPGSYDSRYWGFIDEKNIAGTAYPLL